MAERSKKRLELSTREPERRSQAERTAETRAKILAAVVESIAEVGFPKTTAAEITRRAGVTWGAVQHHFGGKDGLCRAVLEDSFDRYAERLEGIADEDASTEKRVGLFVDRAWEHFRSPHYRSTFEILRHAAPLASDAEPSWQAEMFRAWNRVWDEIFDGLPRRRRDRVMLQHYTISVLSGLAGMQALEGPEPIGRDDEIDLLKDTLVRELAREA